MYPFLKNAFFNGWVFFLKDCRLHLEHGNPSRRSIKKVFLKSFSLCKIFTFFLEKNLCLDSNPVSPQGLIRNRIQNQRTLIRYPFFKLFLPVVGWSNHPVGNLVLKGEGELDSLLPVVWWSNHPVGNLVLEGEGELDSPTCCWVEQPSCWQPHAGR
jgi:hypothetical protein